ncbi:MAG: hypothetical protein K0S65_3606 [Labilithrix sp.]|nr:hypothetical protein [Labilithrix sp.]
MLGEWTTEVMHRLEAELEGDRHWAAVLASRATRSVHLAVFVQPFLGQLLGGQKLVESRFTVRRSAPFERAASGDIVLVKEAAGPVRAVCEIGQAWFIDDVPRKLTQLREQFSAAMGSPGEAFWASCARARYASLLELGALRIVTPVACPKRDRRAWVVLIDTRQARRAPRRRSSRAAPTW